MDAAIVAFQAKAIGPGTQTVPGFTNRDGIDFVPDVVLFQSAFAALQTLTSGAIPIGGYSDFRGVDTGAVRSALTATDAYSGFNFKPSDSGISFGDHSILDVWTDNFGQAQIYRAAKISAFRAGEIDILYDGNLRTGDTIFALGLAGTGLSTSFTNDVNGAKATPAKPQGLLGLPLPVPAASGSTTWGTGGHNVPWGFATRDGAYGVADVFVVNQGNNWSAQLTDAWGCAIDGSGVMAATTPTVSAWADLSFTIANGGAGTSNTMVFSGDLIRCRGGSFDQPLATGDQIVNLGIDAHALWLFSIGRVAGAGVNSPAAQAVMGWAAGSRQAGFWTGERTNGNVPPLYGGRYLASNSMLRFGNPDGISTTFGSVASLGSLDPLGYLTLGWSAVDGVARQILWFALGLDAVTPPPPPPSNNVGCPVLLPNPVFTR